MIQTLRAENAQIKDQMLSQRSLNRDYSERAVDDARRLAQQEEAIERLERSVLAYQRERDDLETAFRELRDSLPDAVRSALSSRSDVRAATAPEPRAEAENERLAEAPRPRTRRRPERPIPTDLETRIVPRGGWAASSSGLSDIADADSGP